MKTECSPKQLAFDGVGRRKLVATFDADHISSDGGLVLRASCYRNFSARSFMSITAVSSFAAVDMLTSLHETRLTFAIDAPPDGDLLLIADARGASFGINATEAYRFGRPEPTLALPKPTGREVKLGPQVRPRRAVPGAAALTAVETRGPARRHFTPAGPGR